MVLCSGSPESPGSRETRSANSEAELLCFHCDLTPRAHAEDNLAGAAVVNTPSDDGLPGLKTDWSSHRGLTKPGSDNKFPDPYIDRERTSKAKYILRMGSRAQR
jgi:hypothetical protein